MKVGLKDRCICKGRETSNLYYAKALEILAERGAGAAKTGRKL
jgi:hypothetical protein